MTLQNFPYIYNMERDFNLLKEVLSVPTKTYKEGLMVEFLEKWLTDNNFEYYLDDMNNI